MACGGAAHRVLRHHAAADHERQEHRAYAWDQVNYHEKVIRTFIDQWPAPDLSNYLSATTPLYHLLLASVGKLISVSPAALQFTGMLFSLGLMVARSPFRSLGKSRQCACSSSRSCS